MNDDKKLVLLFILLLISTTGMITHTTYLFENGKFIHFLCVVLWGVIFYCGSKYIDKILLDNEKSNKKR